MQKPANSKMLLDHFLVCGLGSLGQHCVVALKKFQVKVIAIDRMQPQDWEFDNLTNLLDDLVTGDCRQPSVLEQANIQQCRAAIIVTSDEQVNAETALAVRKINPQTRLVVYSAKSNFNELLAEHLGNFVAFEPTQLPAPAFALAALATETSGFFNLEGHWLRVVKRTLPPGDRWCDLRVLHELNTHSRRILEHISDDTTPKSHSFHHWEQDARLRAGDTVVYIEVTTKPSAADSEKIVKNTLHNPRNLLKTLKHLDWKTLKQQVTDENRFKQIGIIVYGLFVLFLWAIGAVWYHSVNYPNKSFANSLFISAMLLLGGFGDLFGGFEFKGNVPLCLRIFSLVMTIAGTILVGILYSVLTEILLAAKFQLNKRRPPIPQKDHVVIVGLGRVGQRIAALLQEYQHSLVGVTLHTDFDMSILPKMPLIVGSLKESLSKANLKTAKSVVVVTDDEMLNLEISLMACRANPETNLVIRTFGQGLSDNLAQLLPKAQVLCAYAVAAEAFTGAAFGENILHLFRLNQKTILVTEYQIRSDDTLDGLLLSEVAYGYGVVPILYQKEKEHSKLMPSEDIRLATGDRIVLLATINGLRRIELGISGIMPKSWRIHVQSALTKGAVFEGSQIITRVSGCSPAMATDLMSNLPGTLPTPLYKHQAQRLVRELRKTQVTAHLVPITPQQDTGNS